MQDEEFGGLRHGRRAERGGKRGRKLQPHQRIATLASSVPDIEDIHEANEIIKKGLGNAVTDALDEEWHPLLYHCHGWLILYQSSLASQVCSEPLVTGVFVIIRPRIWPA